MTPHHTPPDAPPSDDVFKSETFKDFLLYLLKGISFFSHRLRTASIASPTVDRFVAKSLSALVGEHPVTLDGFQAMVKDALRMRKTVSNLYENACNFGRIEKEHLPLPAVREFFLEKETLAAQARGLFAKKLSRDQKDFYWESVCVERLGTIGTIIVSAGDSADREYDVSGFMHKALDYLSRDLSSVELVAMADQLEKARLKIVNALLSGDTLVEIPAPRITLSDIKGTHSD